MRTLLGLLLLLTVTTGCQTLDKYIDTAAVTTTTYLVGGPIPAAAAGLTEIAYEELTPYNKPTTDKIQEIKTPSQAIYASISDISKDILYGIIAFLIITNILLPLIRGRIQRQKPSVREEALIELMMKQKS